MTTIKIQDCQEHDDQDQDCQEHDDQDESQDIPPEEDDHGYQDFEIISYRWLDTTTVLH